MTRLAVVAALIVGLFAAPVAPAHARAAGCGKNDLPETGVQGEVPLRDQLSGRALKGYNCGLALVGHTSLRGVAANMAWAGHCAYIATIGQGVNVVDVSNPQRPRRLGLLQGRGTNVILETIAAREYRGRAILVAGRYGYFARAPLAHAPMEIYDVSDCARPKHLTTFRWPENAHNLTISPDLSRVYATLPLQALDISDPRRPRYLGNIEQDLVGGPLQADGLQVSNHELTTSADGNTLYFGGVTASTAGFTVADVTGYPQRKPRVVTRADGRGHSVNVATINGRTYAVHSEESIVAPTANSCFGQTLAPFAGVAEPWLSDLSDPAKPQMHVSRLRLAINKPQHCARAVADNENATVHYHDVDDPTWTTFVMASMSNAGLRVFDVRDPLHPTEVAYFNPGMLARPSDNRFLDKAWGHVRYDATRGQIWFATQGGGFWVVELEPQLRARLGLPARPVLHPNGRAPKAGLRVFGPPPALEAKSGYYCTVAALPI